MLSTALRKAAAEISGAGGRLGPPRCEVNCLLGQAEIGLERHIARQAASARKDDQENREDQAHVGHSTAACKIIGYPPVREEPKVPLVA